MILNSDPTASQKLGVSNTVTPLDNLMNAKDKLLAWRPSTQTFAMIVGAVVILIVERKINYKAKTVKLNYGGKK